jgi:hypothetical protein
MISPTEAAQAAERGLLKIDSDNNADLAAAYAAGHVGIPLLVTRLDMPDRDYYLVPWQDQRGVLLVVQVDALTGEMSAAAAFPKPQPTMVMSPNQAQSIVEAQLQERVIGEPKLVWQPSRESSSSLQPFYEVAIKDGKVFVGVSGSIYPSLTPFGKGG